MRKPTNKRNERNGLGLLAVVSLACTLAAFGCTTNRTPGNGQSTEQTPEVGPANTSSTPGSSSGTTNPPMANGAIVVDPTAVDAQATLAADQAYQGRVLGAVSPPLTTQGNAPTAPTGQFVNPAVIVNPQSTVNSSVSSAVMAPTALTTVPMSGDATNATATSATATNSAIATPAVTNVPSQSALATAPAATSTTSSATTTSTTAKTAKATTTSKTSKKKSAKATAKAPTTKATAAATTAQPVHVETSVNGDVVVTNTTNPPQHQ